MAQEERLTTIESKEKVVSLFKYIKELYATRSTVIMDIKQQEWVKLVSEIPDASEYITFNYADRDDEDGSSDATLLSVRKPEFSPCPELPIFLKGSIKGDWKDYKKKITFIDMVEDAEEFESNDDAFHVGLIQLNEFNKWEIQRDLWVAEQTKRERVQKLFQELYSNYMLLNRESETLELMVGQGTLVTQGTNKVNHPVLLKRLRMEFEPETNAIKIMDTNIESELYTMAFQGVDGINHGEIGNYQDKLKEEYYHPLDRLETPKYLTMLIHSLSPNGVFIGEGVEDRPAKLKMLATPTFFIRRRLSGIIKAIDDIISNVEKGAEIPGPFLNLIGDNVVQVNHLQIEQAVSESLALLGGEDKNILLAKDANREQLEIAKQIEMYNAVLVQGPPGTGKTHTIANLMGHFLAQGKSVLVTSHTKKALSVVKDKIPANLQNLCVSILEDNNKDMEQSVDGITEFISAHSSTEIFAKVEKLKQERLTILDQLNANRERLFSIHNKEYDMLTIDGKEYTVSEAAQFVYENADKYGYIPGNVTLHKDLQSVITSGELEYLYKTNCEISIQEEQELGYVLPDPNTMLTPFALESLIKDLADIDNTIKSLEQELGLTLHMDGGILYDKDRQLWNGSRVKSLSGLSKGLVMETPEDWALAAMIAGKKGGSYRNLWKKLILSIQDTSYFAEKILESTVGKKIEIGTLTPNEVVTVLNQIKMHLGTGKQLSKMVLWSHKSWKEVLATVTVNNTPIVSVEDCELVLAYLTLGLKRDELEALWETLITNNGGTSFKEFGNYPEQVLIKRVDQIEKHLNWYAQTYNNLDSTAYSYGFNLGELTALKGYNFNSEVDEMKSLLDTVYKTLPKYIELVNLVVFKKNESSHLMETHKKMLTDGKLANSELCRLLVRSLDELDLASYTNHFAAYTKFYTKYYVLNDRVSLLGKLGTIAPDWANQIKNRIGIHGKSVVPNKIDKAWLWKQFSGVIDEITEEPFERLQTDSMVLNKRFKQATTRLSESLAWYHLLLKVEGDVEKKQALQGWKMTQKKIGKGTGKKAPMYKREARKLMVQCQDAVPAWIMTINKALESLSPSENKFDIVIIDEASQSDISSLAVMYLADKIIIVGDDEQVSPSGIGMDTTKQEALTDTYIKDKIPNWHLYDMNSSLYDIAKTTFPTLMLREHFRCVPEIIGYSNQLSYDNKIIPLKDSSNSSLTPSTVTYHVDGIRKGKSNEQEAQAIVALMLSCMKQPEYDGMTFGAISLLGDDQAKRITDLAYEKMELKDFVKRDILCGNASQFQGDERDVIFLSVIDSNETNRPLRIVGEGIGNAMKQRYNVAVSRARDQVWVVHSLDPVKDLKVGDMRKDLIDYMNKPLLPEPVNIHSDSPFENAVARSLQATGYHIVQNWKAGPYILDMVAISGDGSEKVAIVCDGGLSATNRTLANMERETILGRLGWRFIHVRGSEYYRSPNDALSKVMNKLSDYGIQTAVYDLTHVVVKDDLLQRVITGAEQLLVPKAKK